MSSAPLTARHLRHEAERLPNGAVLIIGDLMLDEYLFGDAERISPEAPVPVVKIAQTKLVLGGAGNVARNITALGGSAHLVGVTGEDAGAENLTALLQSEKIPASVIRSGDRPTTIKTRVLARQQQMLRIDREVNAPIPQRVRQQLLAVLADLLPLYPVAVLSDYGKGLVSKELLCGIRELAGRNSPPTRILVDPKTPNFPLYTQMFLLTPNARETSEGSGLPTGGREEILKAGAAILKKLGCSHLLTTLGAQGMALFRSAKEVWHIPTTAQAVFDVTGAGDTVIATTALGLAAGLDLLDACVLANYAAGVVVGEVGAAVTTRQELRAVLRTVPFPVLERWK